MARLYTKAELPMMQPHRMTAIPLWVLEMSMAYLEYMMMINCTIERREDVELTLLEELP